MGQKEDGAQYRSTCPQSDELASDSEDEKRLRRANSTAVQKRKKDAAEYAEKRLRNQRFATTKPYNFNAYAAPTPVPYSGLNYRKFRTTDTCFACGKAGHWRSQCPSTSVKPGSYAGPSTSK